MVLQCVFGFQLQSAGLARKRWSRSRVVHPALVDHQTGFALTCLPTFGPFAGEGVFFALLGVSLHLLRNSEVRFFISKVYSEISSLPLTFLQVFHPLVH